MKTAFLSKSARHISLAAAVILMAGCTPHKKAPAPAPGKKPVQVSQCPANYPKHYADAAQGYSICLPKNVTKTNGAGFPAGTAEFIGFSVPAGTNLTSKRLIVQPGANDLLQGATPFGQFTADGVTFKRVKATDAGAGQQYLNIIYVWKHAGKQLCFVFEHHAVNPGIVGPPHPAVYNEAQQIAISEAIMKTFHRLP